MRIVSRNWLLREHGIHHDGQSYATIMSCELVLNVREQGDVESRVVHIASVLKESDDFFILKIFPHSRKSFSLCEVLL